MLQYKKVGNIIPNLELRNQDSDNLSQLPPHITEEQVTHLGFSV